MPRRLRQDYPGAWHHVMSRGIAKRTLFESDRDVRFFLSCLARQVKAGDLEVHVYAVMATHFHLLVGSPRGRLSAAMQRALDRYARWFNRSRGRDGPLFRGRFANRIVGDSAYLAAVVRYIDLNPVSAGLAARPEDYPHGSARHYVSRSGPPWLTRGEIEAWLRDHCGGDDLAAAYRETFGGGFDAARNAWAVERTILPPRGAPEATTLLRGLSSPAWMRRKSLLADGTLPGVLVLHPDVVREAVRRVRDRDPMRRLRVRRTSYGFWEVLECGALRALSGMKHDEVAERMGLQGTGARRRWAIHETALRVDAEYAAEFRRIVGGERQIHQVAAIA